MGGVFQLCTEFAVSNRALGTTARLGLSGRGFNGSRPGHSSLLYYTGFRERPDVRLFVVSESHPVDKFAGAERRQSSRSRSKECQRDKYYYREKGANRGLLSCG